MLTPPPCADGVDSFSYPLFPASYSHVYTPDALPYPCLAVLGNHDYGDGLSFKDMFY